MSSEYSINLVYDLNSFPLCRCIEACEAFESCTGELGDVEQLMNSLQVRVLHLKSNVLRVA